MRYARVRATRPQPTTRPVCPWGEAYHLHGDTASVLELRVAKEDLGRVIGKHGRTVNSIRTILNAVASRTNCRVVLEIIEEK